MTWLTDWLIDWLTDWLIDWLTYWLNNFSTSELQKVVRTLQFLHILTCKCASRHNGMPFFKIATSKISPTPRCFVHFDLPQRRAIFGHLNFQKLQKRFAPQRRAIFGHLNFKNYKCASRHSGVLVLDIWTSKIVPRMWCFAHFDLQMCFGPQRRAIFHFCAEHQEPRIIEKTQRFATFLTFGTCVSAF